MTIFAFFGERRLFTNIMTIFELLKMATFRVLVQLTKSVD